MPRATAEQQQREAKLWRAYRRRRDVATRNQLVENYISLAWKIARQQAWRRSMDAEELLASATIGLMWAVEHFDPAKGVKFATFATPRIRGAILDDIRELDWVPRLERARIKHGKQVIVPRFLPLVNSRSQAPEAQNLDVAFQCDPGSAIERLDRLRESLRGLSQIERVILISYYWEEKTMRETAESLGLSESRISQILSALYERLKECRNEASDDHA